MKSKPDSNIKKKLLNIKESFDIAKENEQKPTGAKLIKKLAMESLNLPPKMQAIDIEKRERTNRDILNMIDNMVSKEIVITRGYDISTILVDQKADSKIIYTDVRHDQTAKTTPRSPTLPKPRTKIIKQVQQVTQIEEKVQKNNDNVSSDNEKPETEMKNNKIYINNESNEKNLNNNKNNEKQIIENEKFDLDVLDYSEMDGESTSLDDTSEKSNNNLQINENDDVICSDSVENTSRSSRKKVTSTSNDMGVPNNDNDNSSPNKDNSTPNNDNCIPDNDNSQPNNVNNIVDSTQSNDKPLDNDAFHYTVVMMKMFLAQLSISFNSIYEFM